LSGEATYCHENLHAGVQVLYDRAIVKSEKGQPDKLLYNLKGGYIAKDQQLAASVEQEPNKDNKSSVNIPVLNIFSLQYLYTLTDTLKFGFGASVEKHSARGPEIHTATEYKVDKDTVIKSKFSFVNSSVADDRDFRVAVGLKQNVTERVNVTVGADLNARAILGTGKSTLGTTKPHSFGFDVKFQ